MRLQPPSCPQKLFVAVMKQVATWGSPMCQEYRVASRLGTEAASGQQPTRNPGPESNSPKALDAANSPMRSEAHSPPPRLSDETLADAVTAAGSLL